jgi:N-acetylmuramoyl-L-alanine amidase
MNFASRDITLTAPRALSMFSLLLALVFTLLITAAPDEKRIPVYTVVANYSLPVSEHNGKDYIGLLEVLEPLGTVSAKTSGNRWKLTYNNADFEFSAGGKKVRAQDKNFDLPADFLLENGRGLVPISSLGMLLPRILGGPVTFNEAARRLLVGNVAVHFTAQVTKTNPPKLVMNFTAPVNPTIATEPGKLRMAFTHEAVVAPGSQLLTFDSSIIPSASFRENNGAAELVVSSASPLLATFSNNGRTITIAPPNTPVIAAPVKPPATSQVPPAPTVLLPPTPTAPIALAGPHYFAVVDASHGGDERGAALSELIAEKDVTLAIARILRQELMSRGLPTMLVRDADITLTADQRASAANSAGAAIYICVHASSEGRGVRLYTALLPPDGTNHGPFVDWDIAQAPFQPVSLVAEEGVAESLKQKEIPVRSLTAALRPLNNVAIAALSLEVAPSTGDISQLTSSAYQQIIAAAVATGLVDVRDKLRVEQK